jgi:hypothetical protein
MHRKVVAFSAQFLVLTFCYFFLLQNRRVHEAQIRDERTDETYVLRLCRTGRALGGRIG